MVKAFCIWCEPCGNLGKHGYFWIHEDCANKLMDIKGDIKSVREILEGTHPRNEKDEDRLRVVEKFIQDMEEFDRRWQGTVEILENIRSGKR